MDGIGKMALIYSVVLCQVTPIIIIYYNTSIVSVSTLFVCLFIHFIHQFSGYSTISRPFLVTAIV